MKQFFNIFFLAIVVAGCNDHAATAGNESKTTVNDGAASEVGSNNVQSDITSLNDVNVDTLGMAEFLALKAAEAEHSRQSNGIQSRDISDISGINVDTIGFAEFKRLKAETARQAYNDSIRRAEIIAERKRYNSSRNATTTNSRTTSKKRASTDETESSEETEVVKETAPAVKEKKGWSKKAKGAVIGAATGAAAGAVINKKNRGVGGVVGGVVGAAAGYGVGRHKDKKGEKKEVVKDTIDEQQ